MKSLKKKGKRGETQLSTSSKITFSPYKQPEEEMIASPYKENQRPPKFLQQTKVAIPAPMNEVKFKQDMVLEECKAEKVPLQSLLVNFSGNSILVPYDATINGISVNCSQIMRKITESRCNSVGRLLVLEGVNMLNVLVLLCISPQSSSISLPSEIYPTNKISYSSFNESSEIQARYDSGCLRTLDSSIKRNTAVIKKLKQINEEQREGLMEDLRNVNLSKFVSEAVTSICDAKLRTSDIQVAVQICSLLHQRYKDFSPSLVQGLLKVFFPGKSGEDLDVDKNSKAMKKRSTLKLLLELYFVGVTEDSKNLKDIDNTQTNLTLLASFARQGRVFLGLPLSGQETQEEFLKGHSMTTDQKKVFRKAFHTYYDGVAELLQSEHASLRQMEHEDVKMFNAKVEPSDDNVSSYEKLRKSYDHLYRNVSSMIGLKKRIQELGCEVDVANAEMEEVKCIKETTEQELKGYELQLLYEVYSNPEARISIIQDEISRWINSGPANPERPLKLALLPKSGNLTR
uniref:MIF4G domain-containing protein n=1 Tax=Salix viminalis TaxID=40686 RepID=A0A6N2LBX2_SALVM